MNYKLIYIDEILKSALISLGGFDMRSEYTAVLYLAPVGQFCKWAV
jgi:hypothetical protein